MRIKTIKEGGTRVDDEGKSKYEQKKNINYDNENGERGRKKKKARRNNQQVDDAAKEVGGGGG